MLLVLLSYEHTARNGYRSEWKSSRRSADEILSPRLSKNPHIPRDAQRDVPSAEVASQASSILSLVSGKGSEISLPYGNVRAMKDALKPNY